MTTKEICRMERQIEEMNLSFDDRELFVMLALAERKDRRHRG